MARRVDIVLNRHARHLRSAAPLRELVHRTVQASAGPSHEVLVHETWSLSDLSVVSRTIAARGTDAVVLAGGDGSCTAGLSALQQAFGASELPEIALAPAGTVNTVARNWGARGGRAPAVARAVRQAILGSAEIVARPTLQLVTVRGDHEEPQASLGFIFGAGLVTRFFDLYYAAPSQGYRGAAALVGQIFLGSLAPRWSARSSAMAQQVLTPVPCILHVDGVRQAPSAFSLVAASVVMDLGLHMRLTYRAGERRDRFHAVASGLGPTELGPQMPRVLLGRRLQGAGHVDTLARSLELEFPPGDGGGYVLDGEVVPCQRVRIELGPELRVRG